MDTKLIVQVVEQSNDWLGLTTENWIAIAATVIALIVALVALAQWYSSREAHKQAHTPILKSISQHPEPGIDGYVALTNSGLGPAMQQEINIKNNGETIQGNLAEAFVTLAQELSRRTGITVKAVKPYRYQKGFPIGQDETIKLVEFRLSYQNGFAGHPNTSAINQLGTTDLDTELFNQNIQIEVVYQDIFGRKHTICDPRLDEIL